MVTRWQLYDSTVPETYVFEMNPQEMGPIFPERVVTTTATTAVLGRALVTEGQSKPRQWEFSGIVRTSTAYAALKKWAEKLHRVKLTDHFGRSFDVILLAFEPRPVLGSRAYWRHEYTMRALIVSEPTAPTVGLDP